jgi:hypothetical protein
MISLHDYADLQGEAMAAEGTGNLMRMPNQNEELYGVMAREYDEISAVKRQAIIDEDVPAIRDANMLLTALSDDMNRISDEGMRWKWREMNQRKIDANSVRGDE